MDVVDIRNTVDTNKNLASHRHQINLMREDIYGLDVIVKILAWMDTAQGDAALEATTKWFTTYYRGGLEAAAGRLLSEADEALEHLEDEAGLNGGAS